MTHGTARRTLKKLATGRTRVMGNYMVTRLPGADRYEVGYRRFDGPVLTATQAATLISK
jgi:hypothetical protein